jgi:hypothetical protein
LGIRVLGHNADEEPVDKHYFVLALFVGAAFLALWCYVRFESRSPSSMSRVLLHTLVAMLALRIASATVGLTVGDSPGQTMLVLFVVMLPALVYVFLASLWVLRMLRSAMPR